MKVDKNGSYIDVVFRVDNVPRLQPVKCTQFWLDATLKGSQSLKDSVANMTRPPYLINEDPSEAFGEQGDGADAPPPQSLQDREQGQDDKGNILAVDLDPHLHVPAFTLRHVISIGTTAL